MTNIQSLNWIFAEKRFFACDVISSMCVEFYALDVLQKDACAHKEKAYLWGNKHDLYSKKIAKKRKKWKKTFLGKNSV